MDFFSGNGSRKFISFRLGNEMSGQPTQGIIEEMETDQESVEQIPEPEVSVLPVDKTSFVELSSTTDTKSCEAYFTRKVESLSAIEATTMSPNGLLLGTDKVSVCEAVAITPGLNELVPESHVSDDVTKVVFLDKPDSVAGDPEDTGLGPDSVQVLGTTPDLAPIPAPAVQSGQTGEGRPETTALSEQEGDQGLMDSRSQTADDSCFGMENDTGSIARSTLAQAFYCQKPPTNISCPPDSSNESRTPVPPEPTSPAPLTSSSRLIMKQYFEETNPTYLFPGHPTVVFNQNQVSSILRIVADESARASFEMLNSVVVRASQLSLRRPAGTTSRARTRTVLDPETDTDIVSDSGMTYNTGEGDSSPGFTSDAESRRDLQSSVSLPVPASGDREGQLDQGSLQMSPECPSPGGETLASLRQEAFREKVKTRRQTHVASKSKGPQKPTRKAGRVMKEEYFDSMPWTRVFVSGPLDTKWNPNKIYCRICKCNVSIRSKRPTEVLRHHSTERHYEKINVGDTSISRSKTR